MRPNSRTVRATSASSFAASVTSQGAASARRPKPRTAVATASISRSVRAAQTTSAPISAKAALSFMTRQLAAEFAPRVRVNALAVGAVETSALRPFLTPEIRSQMEAMTPMRRIGTVEDVALAALWLCSPAGGWVTGKVVEVDGGTESTNWPFE